MIKLDHIICFNIFQMGGFNHQLEVFGCPGTEVDGSMVIGSVGEITPQYTNGTSKCFVGEVVGICWGINKSRVFCCRFFFKTISQWLIVGLGWWFGILRVPLSSNPFHKGISGIQTTKTNQQLTFG